MTVSVFVCIGPVFGSLPEVFRLAPDLLLCRAERVPFVLEDAVSLDDARCAADLPTNFLQFSPATDAVRQSVPRMEINQHGMLLGRL